jgi:hypothetical protein
LQFLCPWASQESTQQDARMLGAEGVEGNVWLVSPKCWLLVERHPVLCDSVVCLTLCLLLLIVSGADNLVITLRQISVILS